MFRLYSAIEPNYILAKILTQTFDLNLVEHFNHGFHTFNS